MSSEITFPRPNNYPYKDVFYFDGEVAMIYGRYKDQSENSIGLRWMVGESDLGYPSVFGNQMWMVVPKMLARYIMDGIFRDLENKRKSILDFQEFMDAYEYIKSVT